MNLLNTECKSSKPYSLGSKVLNNKILTETSKNISHKSGTVNDLNFVYQQQLLNEPNKCTDNVNTMNLSNNIKSTISFLDIFNTSGDIRGKINTLYSLAENINLDKTFEEILNGMNKATKTVKSIFKVIL